MVKYFFVFLKCFFDHSNLSCIKNIDFEHLIFIHFNNINDKRNATIFSSLFIFLHNIMRQKTEFCGFSFELWMVVVIYRLPCHPPLWLRPRMSPLLTGPP
jgi:hypothetical protein